MNLDLKFVTWPWLCANLQSYQPAKKKKHTQTQKPTHKKYAKPHKLRTKNQIDLQTQSVVSSTIKPTYKNHSGNKHATIRKYRLQNLTYKHGQKCDPRYSQTQNTNTR